jgi:hypothetical protein
MRSTTRLELTEAQRRELDNMSKYEIPFLTAAVHAFGERYAMTRQAAFNYLH